MRVLYRGHEIDAHRGKSLGGDVLLYYSVFRESDGYECTSGFSTGADTVREWIKMLKERIDNELSDPDPWGEHAAAPAPAPPAGERHRCSGCGHRWTDIREGFRLNGAELCGDCWRKAQPILHAPAGETARERIAEIRRHREKGWTAHWSEVEWLMAEWDRLAAQLAKARKQAFEDGIAAIQRNIDLDAIAATSGGECIAILQALKETR